MTKLTTTIERELALADPKSGKLLVVRLSLEDGVPTITMKEKGTRTTHVKTLAALWSQLSTPVVVAPVSKPAVKPAPVAPVSSPSGEEE